MFKLMQFEMRRLFKSIYSLVMVMILVISISSYFVYNYIHTERIEDAVESAKNMSFPYQRDLYKLKEEIKADPSLADNYSIQSDMEYYENSIVELDAEKNAFINHDWHYLLDEEIPDAKARVESNKANPLNYNMIRWMTNFTEEVYYERMVWLRDNNIRPVLPIHYFSEMTVYDQEFQDEDLGEIVTDLHNKHSSSAIYFLYRLFGIGLGIIGVAFFLFLLGDILTKEGLQRQGPIHFLFTQPIARGKVMVSKFLTLLLTTILIIIGSGLFSVLLGIIFDRLGAWNYPVLIYQPEESFHFMPMLLFIALSALLFFMVLVFSYSLLFFFSILTKRTTVAIGLTFGVILIGIMFSENADANLSAYNPFHYFQVNDIISMEFAVVHENFNMTLTNGLLTLGILSGFLWLGTYVVSKIR